jgi:hypothetical protein
MYHTFFNSCACSRRASNTAVGVSDVPHRSCARHLLLVDYVVVCVWFGGCGKGDVSVWLRGSGRRV